MNPTNLGRQNGALVLEVLKVLGRPATSYEVAERVADVYRLPLHRIRPVVIDVLEGGSQHGFFSSLNGRYSVVQPVVEQLGRDIDQYAADIMAGYSAEGSLPQMSTLMLKLQQLDGSPPMVMGSRYPRATSGEQREHMPSGDVSLDARLLMLPFPRVL
ncbi:uncharacterized protein LOC6552048 [Drosophila erecta]|uniref:GG17309 n=1 Tax=Drosophila erecta TaxID=7220 RepID=B3P4M9_DROER|nr:uncharacterized protein LOC6552048 [Drosophila erecta]EDV49682.1 uncharacterized protein Dere_GG17309 [Drosophila erecta]